MPWLAATGSACGEAEPDGWGYKDTGLPGVTDRLELVDASFLPAFWEGFETLRKL